MRFENASFWLFTIFPGHHPLNAAWMTTRQRRTHCARKIITVSNTRAPRTTDSGRLSPIGISLAGIPHRPVPYQIRSSCQHGYSRLQPSRSNTSQKNTKSTGALGFSIREGLSCIRLGLSRPSPFIRFGLSRPSPSESSGSLGFLLRKVRALSAFRPPQNTGALGSASTLS